MYDRVLSLAVEAGRMILENGGEVFRVEETVERICKAYSKDCECSSFVTPTVVMVSMIGQDGKNYSTMKRIKSRGVNLHKVDEVNRLSRQSERGKLSMEQMRAELAGLKNQKERPVWLRVLVLGLAVAGFSVLFGGSLPDVIAAFAIGCAVQTLRYGTEYLGFNAYIVNLFSGMLAVLLGYGASRLGFGYMDVLVSSVIMLAVPGMLFTNALRDIVAGDLMSGSTRLIETLFIAVATAAGSGLAFRLLYFLGLLGAAI